VLLDIFPLTVVLYIFFLFLFSFIFGRANNAFRSARFYSSWILFCGLIPVFIMYGVWGSLTLSGKLTRLKDLPSFETREEEPLMGGDSGVSSGSNSNKNSSQLSRFARPQSPATVLLLESTLNAQRKEGGDGDDHQGMFAPGTGIRIDNEIYLTDVLV
jgi:hypothetical protein